jgi:hypothetical protein
MNLADQEFWAVLVVVTKKGVIAGGLVLGLAGAVALAQWSEGAAQEGKGSDQDTHRALSAGAWCGIHFGEAGRPGGVGNVWVWCRENLGPEASRREARPDRFTY